MHILWTYWNNLPEVWNNLLFKEWLYFVHKKESLSLFLWDESYGLNFLLRKALGMQSDDPESDITNLSHYINKKNQQTDIEILSKIFNMEFLTLDDTITYLSPIRYFRNLKVVDFHCSNESQITDFLDLQRDSEVIVLDYADYQIVDFDNSSNIRQFQNIRYIKGYGIPQEMGNILKNLSNYNIS